MSRHTPGLTATQAHVYQLVAQGVGTAGEVRQALAQQGVASSLRAVQRLLKRVRDKGLVQTVRCPRGVGRRGHFHLGTEPGDDNFRQHCPEPPPPHLAGPAWAEAAVRQGQTVQTLSDAEFKKRFSQAMTELAAVILEPAFRQASRPRRVRRPSCVPPRYLRLPPNPPGGWRPE